MLLILRAGIWTGVSWVIEKTSAFIANIFTSSRNSPSLSQENKRLKQECEDLKKELEKYKQQKYLMDFICHEIRTPLNIVCVHTDLIKSNMQYMKTHSSAGLEEIEAWIEVIATASDQQKKIINQFLDLSKWNEGKFELNITSFNLKGIFLRVEKSFKPILAQKELFLDLDLPSSNDIWVETDEMLLIQLLNNLISNAIKFTLERSAITLRLTYPEARSVGEEILITVTVKDSGIGMSPKSKHRLFNRFSQTDATIASQFGGSGLGLMICKYIAIAMGGDINLVESQEGVGSTFQFTIRCKKSLSKKEEKEVSSPSTKKKTITTSPMTILIVDDNDLSRKATALQLKALGYTCQTVGSGMHAIELCKENLFNLIFMDINMPEMNGIETTQKIRDHEKTGKYKLFTHIIGLSSNTLDDQLKHKLSENGMNGYLVRPCNKQELQQAIKSCETLLSPVSETRSEKSPPIYATVPPGSALFRPSSTSSQDSSENKNIEGTDSTMSKK